MFFVQNLTSADRRTEDVCIFPVVVAERELRDIERQILAADLVERSHDAALQKRPEALDCVGVNRADNVASSAVADSGVRELLSDLAIGGIVVRAKQADFGRNCLTSVTVVSSVPI